MSKVLPCKSCGKEVAKSAKQCPHCGEKLKMGMFMKLVIFILAIAVLGSIFSPSKEDKLKVLKGIAAAQPDDIKPSGELAQMFELMSKNTDIQRENKEKELVGKIVEWTLPVFEVSLVDKEAKIYKVQTSGDGKFVGTFVKIQAMDDQDDAFLQSLNTGKMVHFKGKITGTFMRNIQIEPAVLVSK